MLLLRRTLTAIFPTIISAHPKVSNVRTRAFQHLPQPWQIILNHVLCEGLACAEDGLQLSSPPVKIHLNFPEFRGVNLHLAAPISLRDLLNQPLTHELAKALGQLIAVLGGVTTLSTRPSC